MMKSFGHRLFWVILIFCMIMVNPPVLYWFNDYCVENPITFGWPTMYLWLEFWFVLMIIDFLVAAWKLKFWDCHQDQQEIEQVARNE